MKRRMLALILCIGALLAYYQLALHPVYPTVPLKESAVAKEKILLVPLDGRPPCRSFVMEMGKIADFDIVVPPQEIQDYYSQKGDTIALESWLMENIKGSHAVILSIDQLLYGGLLAARENACTEPMQKHLLSFLNELHQSSPEVPIYAFSILPRLMPQDTIDGYFERKALVAYSRLIGKKHAGLPIDEDELAEIKEKISEESMKKYLANFKESTLLNTELIRLAKKGVFQRLILGQDDGEKYSIPNIEKEKLQNFLAEENISEEKVFLTHGADEIAMTLLTEIKMKDADFHPEIYLQYNDEITPTCIMPYMAVSTEDSAKEKLQMLHAKEASSPQDADFVFFISTNDSDKDTLDSREESLHQLQDYKENNIPVALVDLSKHFQKEETLLPLLIQNDFPINTLSAYAGWNTASNSIGTALSEAIILKSSQKQLTDRQSAIRLYTAQLTFLQNRILEDSFYLKDVIDLVNQSLIKNGYKNTADLDLEHNYRFANAMLQSAMNDRIHAYKATKAFRQPVSFQTPEGMLTLCAKDLHADMYFPWPRTFEIQLQSTILLEECP